MARPRTIGTFCFIRNTTTGRGRVSQHDDGGNNSIFRSTAPDFHPEAWQGTKGMSPLVKATSGETSRKGRSGTSFR